MDTDEINMQLTAVRQPTGMKGTMHSLPGACAASAAALTWGQE